MKLFSALLLAFPLAVAAQTTTLGTHTGAHPAHRRTPAAAASAPCPPAQAAPVTPAGLPPAPAGPAKTAFALRYIDLQEGTGAPALPGAMLTVQYTGWLASNGTKFDSSLDRSEPFSFPQGAHRVIPGWDQGFGGMRTGGKRRLFIPYQLAYGEDGRPPVIPPASDLIFDIELVSVSGGAQPAGAPAPPAPPEPAQPPQPQM